MAIQVIKDKFSLREELNKLRRKVGIVGGQAMGSDTIDDFYSVVGTRKNLIINGDMRVNQRGQASYTSDSAYTLDRWKVGRYDSNDVQISQQSSGASLPEFPYCVRIQQPNGVTKANEIWLSQAVESLNSARLKRKPVTLSFWARKSSSATTESRVSATIFWGSGTDNYVDYNYFASNSISSANKNFQLNQSWTKYTFTVLDSPESTNQIGISFGKWNGPNASGANDYIEITGVQLEAGTTATPFEHLSYGESLAMCKRYYERFTGYGSAAWKTGYAFDTALYFYLPWTVAKRIDNHTAYLSSNTLTDVINVYGNGSSSANIAGLYSSYTVSSTHSQGLSFYMSVTANTYTPRGTALLWAIKNAQWIAADAEI